MQKRISGLLLILLLACGVGAQSSLESNLRKHVEYLASDKLEGRRTGEVGATLAAEYIAKQFTLLGLESARAKGIYFQNFPYFTGVEVAQTGNDFLLGIVENNIKGDAAVAKPVGFSPNADLANAPIVFAGYGIVSPEMKRDDYAGVDAKGKVVMISDGSPDNDNPHSLFGRFDVWTKALIARDKGAVGVLIISKEENFENEKLARMIFDQTRGEAALPTFVISKSTAANIQKTGGRSLVSFKVNIKKKTSPAHNVIGILPGTDPVLKNEAIVIGAHYDHLGRGGQGSLDANSSEIHYGADDNASGTAAMLELARQFAAERKNKRTMIFIAFSGEEEGLLGSKYYVNNPVWPLEKTVAMINLDMVGRLKEHKLTVGGIGTASEWKQLIEDSNLGNGAAKLASIPVPTVMTATDPDSGSTAGALSKASQFNLQLNEDGFGPSDHSSFYGKKIPVLFLFTGTHENYHKPSDTADKINYSGLLRITDFVAKIVRGIGQNPQPPTYAVAKSSGMAGGRTGFNISLGTIPSYADSNDGLVLDGVRENSSAAKAGVKAGDKIVKLAGKDVRNAMDYTYVLGEMKAGEEYEIVVLRGGELLTLRIVPAKR